MSDWDTFPAVGKNDWDTFPKAQSSKVPLPEAITDIPSEIGKSASENWQQIKSGLDPSAKGTTDVLGSTLETGKALAAVPGLLFSPVAGAARSLIGHPMASAIQAAGEPIARAINPNAELPSSQEVYEAVKPAAEQAISLAMPGKAVPKAVLPTAQHLFAAADGDYTVARNMGVTIHPDSVKNFAQTIQAQMERDGLRDYLAPKTFSALKEMQAAPQGSVANIADIDGMRKVLGHAAGDFTNRSEQYAANTAIHALDDYVGNIPDADVLSGDARAAQRVLESARGNWSAAKRAELIEGQEEKAGLQAGATGSGANINNALRQKMKEILTNKKLQRGFSKDELDQMDQIVMGTIPGNLARRIGKLAPSGVVSGALALDIGSTLLSGMPLGATVPALAGSVAKKLGEVSTQRGINKLSEMTRSRAPLAAQLPKQIPAPSRYGALPLGSQTAPQNGVPNVTVPMRAEQDQETASTGRAKGGAVKLSHASVGYVTSSTHLPQKCGGCTMFLPPSGCTLVQSPIKAGGWCRRFKGKHA